MCLFVCLRAGRLCCIFVVRRLQLHLYLLSSHLREFALGLCAGCCLHLFRLPGWSVGHPTGYLFVVKLLQLLIQNLPRLGPASVGAGGDGHALRGVPLDLL